MSQNTTAVAELPTLTGTERQVAWAEEIRAGYLTTPTPRSIHDGSPATPAQEVLQRRERLVASLREAVEYGDPVRPGALETATASLELVREALRCLASITDASWWLDRRGTDPARLLRVAYQEVNGHGRDSELIRLLG